MPVTTQVFRIFPHGGVAQMLESSHMLRILCFSRLAMKQNPEHLSRYKYHGDEPC